MGSPFSDDTQGKAPSSRVDLTPAQFHILLTLCEGPRHGYGIMREIASRTNGAMELGPGTLYRSIKQLLREGLLFEVDPRTDGSSAGGSPRRTYTLTPAGEIRLTEEAQRLENLVRWAQEAAILEGGNP